MRIIGGKLKRSKLNFLKNIIKFGENISYLTNFEIEKIKTIEELSK